MTTTLKKPVPIGEHFVYADAMRLLAILLVVLNHLMFYARPSFHRPLTFGYLGIWGVNCFFVLSGYLLGRSYLKSLLNDEPQQSLSLFYQRRFLRIYPLYFIAIVVSTLTATLLAGAPDTVNSFVLHLFLLQGFSQFASIFPNGPLWTMGIDAGFYIVLPLIALALAPLVRGRSVTIRLRAIVSALVAIAILSIAFRYLEYRAHPAAALQFPVGVVYVRNLFGFACSFAIGTALALVQLSRISISRPVAIAIALGGIALAALEFLGRFEAGANGGMVSLTKLALLDPLAAVSSALLLLSASRLNSRRLFEFASLRIVSTLAALAYAIYLFHWLAIESIELLFVHDRHGFGALGELTIGTFVLVLPVALLVHTYVEKPFLKIKDSKHAKAPIARPIPIVTAGE